MKKWMVCGLISAITAGMAVAEDTNPWWKKPFVKNSDEATQVIPPAPETPPPGVPKQARPGTGEGQRKLTPDQIEKMKAMREGAGARQPGQQPGPEQQAKMEKFKAQHEELMKMGEAARNETDPVKKEALVAQLRTKLTEIADKMHAEAKKRFEQAEKELPKLKARMDDAEKNKAARIEQQLQRILAGEPLERPEMMKHREQGGPGAPKKGGGKPPADK
jgi:hypothetical protein